MKRRTINLSFEEYGSKEELATEDQHLVDAATESAKKAYAPYSSFHVGAAVRLNNGEILSGSNQENAAFPSGMCAERVVLYYAGAKHPEATILAMAVVAMKGGKLIDEVISPCGACRQVLAESMFRGKAPFPLILAGSQRIYKINDGSDLLPFTFNADVI